MDQSQFYQEIIRIISEPSMMQVLGLIFPPIAIFIGAAVAFFASHRSYTIKKEKMKRN